MRAQERLIEEKAKECIVWVVQTCQEESETLEVMCNELNDHGSIGSYIEMWLEINHYYSFDEPEKNTEVSSVMTYQLLTKIEKCSLKVFSEAALHLMKGM